MKSTFLILLSAFLFSNVQSQIFHENMEIPDSVNSSSNGSGAWVLNNQVATSGIYCDSATILNVGDSIVLTTIPFSTVGYDSIFLYFNHICKVEFFDDGYLEVSTDSGLTWNQLRNEMAGPNDNCIYLGNGNFKTQGSRFQEASYPNWIPGMVSDPDNSWWKREIFDISSVLYNIPFAQIRFILKDWNNNGGAGRSGWFLDDIFIDSTLNSDLNVFKNQIIGKVFYDLNSNSVFDNGEIPISGLRVEETNSSNRNFTDSNGFFSFRTNSNGTITIQTDSNAIWAPYFNSVPLTQTAYFSGIGEIDSLNDFAIQPDGVVNDLRLSLTTNNNFWPGTNTLLTINYSNIGNVTLNPTITFHYDSLLIFASSNATPNLVTPDSIVWNFSNLMPFQSGIISIVMTTDSTISDTIQINTSVAMDPVVNDFTQLNNYDSSSVILEIPDFVVDTTDYSMDPNYITVNHDTLVTPDLLTLPFLEYVINFQNVGTGPANQVVVENRISNNLDFNTFELIGFSHNVELSCNSIEDPRKLYYTFDSINLPDSNSNEPESHGFIKYHIKPLTTLVSGNLIANNADIFFDFNAPVPTNIVTTTIIDPLSLIENQVNNDNLKVFPNPVNNQVTIQFYSNQPDAVSINLFNIFGQHIKSVFIESMNNGEHQQTIDVSDLSNGIYLVRLENGSASSTSKFVKIGEGEKTK